MGGQEFDDKRMNLLLKIAVIVCGIGLIGISIHIFSTFSVENPVHFFLAIYYILFGVLLITSEMPIAWTTRHFSFLGYYIGRGIFMLFVGTLIFNTGVWWYVLIACIMFLVAAIYIVLGVACKGKIKKAPEAETDPPKQGFRPASQDEARSIEFAPSAPSAPHVSNSPSSKAPAPAAGSGLPPPLPDNIRPV